MHAPLGAPKPRRLASVPHHFVTTPEIRAQAYPVKNAERDARGRPWALWEGGHCDLILLHFFNAYPDFDRHWVVEYDVRFTGHWSRLFDASRTATPASWASRCAATSTARSGIAGRRCRRRRDAGCPTGTAPGPPSRRTGSAGAAWRQSTRPTAKGWGGHLEAAWPTILATRGMVLEGIGGTGPQSGRRTATASTPARPAPRPATRCRPAR
jgi:hypothetical protein